MSCLFTKVFISSSKSRLNHIQASASMLPLTGWIYLVGIWPSACASCWWAPATWCRPVPSGRSSKTSKRWWPILPRISMRRKRKHEVSRTCVEGSKIKKLSSWTWGHLYPSRRSHTDHLTWALPMPRGPVQAVSTGPHLTGYPSDPVQINHEVWHGRADWYVPQHCPLGRVNHVPWSVYRVF